MRKNLVLSLDPSKSCTGYVLWDLEENTIVDTGTFQIETQGKFRLKTEKYAEETNLYAQFFRDLFEKWQFGVIVTEYPHGSQSATASRALAMVNAVILTFSQLVLDTPAITYLETHTKRAYFGRGDVSKDEVREAMKKEFPDYEPPTRGHKVTRYRDEAICDALLVLHKFLNDHADLHLRA